MAATKPIFIVSDLHLGDGGSRDNFAVGNRAAQFEQFLGFVRDQDGQLIILGDLFEFWQVSLGRALLAREPLLDRLAKMDAKYVVGNHDADLQALVGHQGDFLAHPFFGTMSGKFDQTIGGKKFRFMHGHEVDEFNCGDNPSWGRMLTIFAGIFEERNGSPVLANGLPVEGVLEGFGENLLKLWNWLANKFKTSVTGGSSPSPKHELTPAQNPDRTAEMYVKYWRDKAVQGYDVAVVGHTHQPGHIGGWYFNSGAWVGETNDFLRIEADGKVGVFAWANGKATPNDRELAFEQPKE